MKRPALLLALSLAASSAAFGASPPLEFTYTNPAFDCARPFSSPLPRFPRPGCSGSWQCVDVDAGQGQRCIDLRYVRLWRWSPCMLAPMLVAERNATGREGLPDTLRTFRPLDPCVFWVIAYDDNEQGSPPAFKWYVPPVLKAVAP